MARKRGVSTTVLPRAKWSVLWVVKTKKGKTKIMEYDAGPDLSDALRVKSLLEKADRRAVTLKCKNVGFPPPETLLPRVEYEIVNVKRKGRWKKAKKKVIVDPLREHNALGIFWCPYCMKLRKFVERAGFWHEDKYWVNEKSLYCPMCDVNLKNWHVCQYNPKGWELRSRFEAPRRRSGRK